MSVLTSPGTDLGQEQLPYLLALTHVSGLGPQTLRKLFSLVGDAKTLWQTAPGVLKPHLNEKLLNAFSEAQSRLTPERLMAQYEALGIHLLSYLDPRYPAMLNQIHEAPVLLFVRGNLDALSGKTIAFVGTRNVSEYGRQVTQKLIGELAVVNPCIVSGLAQGVDGLAHRVALDENLQTVAVFGCGLDIIYPAHHKKLAQEILDRGGALVSEYPLGFQPTHYTFPNRNRIIAGLSYGVVIVEGGIKSGSLITARRALEENRQIYAVPGNLFSPGSEGPLYLIKNGAIATTHGNDILEDLRWLIPSSPKASETATQTSLLQSHLSEIEQTVLQAIGYDPTPMELIQQKTAQEASKVSEILTLLELYGLVTPLPGAKVCRK